MHIYGFTAENRRESEKLKYRYPLFSYIVFLLIFQESEPSTLLKVKYT